MKLTPVGVDIAKNVFQIHHVDAETGEIVNKQIKRAMFLEYFANRAPCLIGMEACGGSQHWARRLLEMGHQVKLMPAKFVKAFNIGNMNDMADARNLAGSTAAGQGCGSQDRSAAGRAGAAPDAAAIGEVPHDADQQCARVADRVR